MIRTFRRLDNLWLKTMCERLEVKNNKKVFQNDNSHISHIFMTFWEKKKVFQDST